MVVCFPDSLQVNTLPIDIPKMLFLHIILEDKSSLLLCAVYWPQWHGNNPLHYLIDRLDDIMTTHDCQHIVIVGDLNHHLVMRAFTELTAVQGLHNHVDFPTRQCGGSLNPVLTDLPQECVQCHPLDHVDSSDHHAVHTTVSVAPACDEDHQQVTWLWDCTNWVAMRQALALIDWDSIFTP